VDALAALYRDALLNYLTQRRGDAEDRRGLRYRGGLKHHEPGFSWEQTLGRLLLASRAAVPKKVRPGSLIEE